MRGSPEAPRHASELGARPFADSGQHAFQRHAAEGAASRTALAHLGNAWGTCTRVRRYRLRLHGFEHWQRRVRHDGHRRHARVRRLPSPLHRSFEAGECAGRKDVRGDEGKDGLHTHLPRPFRASQHSLCPSSIRRNLRSSSQPAGTVVADSPTRAERPAPNTVGADAHRFRRADHLRDRAVTKRQPCRAKALRYSLGASPTRPWK